jgi:hypothetical protein
MAAPAAAQAPEGWQMRLDRSTNASDPDKTPEVKFVTMGKGFHVTTGPAAVLWQPTGPATGAYTIKGNFRLVKPSGHNNFYGLVFGGADLDGAKQDYVYFLVSQDGSFLVKHRAGDATTHNVQAKVKHDAVKVPDANGSSTNALEVRVGADKIEYVVNGTVVHSTPKTGMTARADGHWGVRVNHQLEVHIDGLGVTK